MRILPRLVYFRLFLAAAWLALGGLAVAAPFDPNTQGLQKGVTFTDYSPLSANLELARRLVSPLTAAKLGPALAASGKTLREQPVDLAAESFTVFVPAHAPPGGYGLLVFVPPWDEADRPPDGGEVYDRLGIVFVTAAKSGNDSDVLSRRAPLALLAATNVVSHLTVNPDKVFIGGFSGGSRVAMRMALAYPDLFRGALLNAGSDRIGEAGAPMPSPNLWRLFQRSRLVYVTGERDAVRFGEDAASLQSMRRWCVFGVESQTIPWKGHDVAGGLVLEHALTDLMKPAPTDPARLAACTAPIEKALAARLAREAALRTAGSLAEADKERAAIDAKYGWLAVGPEAGKPAE